MCGNLLVMKSTLAKKKKKITTKIFFYILGYFIYFIFFVTFFQSCYLILHNQKVATRSKEQNKKRIMTIG